MWVIARRRSPPGGPDGGQRKGPLEDHQQLALPTRPGLDQHGAELGADRLAGDAVALGDLRQRQVLEQAAGDALLRGREPEQAAQALLDAWREDVRVDDEHGDPRRAAADRLRTL